MKKIVAAFLCGVILTFSGQVFADSISRIGKKVGSEATVLLDKEKLSDAIVIEGKSYLPVRDIAEAFGADVEYIPASKTEKAVIELTSAVPSTDGSTIPATHQIVILKQKMEPLVAELAQLESANIIHEEELQQVEDEYSSAAPWMDDFYKHKIDGKKSSIEANKVKIKELKNEIEEIEKSIKALESAE